MLKIKDILEQLKKYDIETEVKFQINDRAYSELYTIQFIHYADEVFSDELVFNIFDENDENLVEKVGEIDNE